MKRNWLRTWPPALVLAALFFAGLPGPAAGTDIDLSQTSGQDSGTGTVTANLNALVDLGVPTASIALGSNIATTSATDTFADSHDSASPASIVINNTYSNVDVGAYFNRQYLNVTAKAIGTSNSATLTNIDYASTLSSTPKAGQWYDSSTGAYRPWSQTSANYPGLWVFFDDAYEAGSANSNNDFSQSGGSATGTDAGNFTPYMVEVDNTNHSATVSAYPTLKWGDGSTSVSSSDFFFEAVVVYYDESTSPTSTGTEGALAQIFVQVILRSTGGEVMCRQGGASSLGSNWTTSGFDFATSYSGSLNSTSKAGDTTCSILGNRYTPSYTSTGSTKRVVLSWAQQLPLTIGGSTSSNIYAAVAFPYEAPRLDYSFSGVVNAINWSPIDALTSTADDVQYP